MAGFNLGAFINPSSALGPQQDLLQDRPNPFTNPEAWDFSPVGGTPSFVGGGGGFTVPVFGGGMPGQGSFTSTQPVLPTFGGTAGPVGGGGGSSTGSRVLGGLRSFGGWLLDNPEVPLAVAGGLLGYQNQRAAQKANDRAQALIEQQIAELAPLRQAGIANLQGMQRPVAPANLGIDPYNPYATPAQGSSVPSGTTGTPVGSVLTQYGSGVSTAPSRRRVRGNL